MVIIVDGVEGVKYVVSVVIRDGIEVDRVVLSRLVKDGSVDGGWRVESV